MKKSRNSNDSKAIRPSGVTEHNIENDSVVTPATSDERILHMDTSRRDFLKLLGFSFGSAAILASCKRPVQMALPYVNQPPEVTPGKPLYYASTYYDGHEYASVVVKTRDGRPIKIEGNNLSLFNGEGTSARVQASVLSLYDDARLKAPSAGGKQDSWENIDAAVIAELTKINGEGGRIVLLTPSLISPSTTALIEEFSAKFNKTEWVRYNPVSYSAISEANDICFGVKAIPDYRFSNASYVVGINADFLGSWLAPVHFTREYSAARKTGKTGGTMLKHIQFESGLSVTGSNADKRYRIKPSEEITIVTDLYNRVAAKTGAPSINAAPFREDLSQLADNLLKTKGKSIVVSGTNNREIQIIVNAINNLLGNYDKCIDLNNYLNLNSVSDTDFEKTVSDLEAGKIKAVILYNVNPVYDYFGADRFLTGLSKTGLTINMQVAMNETCGKAKYECPVNHYLESWDDAEIVPGQLSLCQPTISTVFNTRSFQDSLLKWTGANITYHEFLKARWEKSYFPKSGKTDFVNFWNESLSNGVFSYTPEKKVTTGFKREALDSIKITKTETAGGEFEVILTENIPVGDGRNSNNPWLIELPDPVSKHSWENIASVSPADAALLGITTGDIIKLSQGVELPAFIQPGQADGTISVALGYGHTQAGPVCKEVGVNMYPFAALKESARSYTFTTQKPVFTQKHRELALTQVHHSMEGRPIVRDTVLSEYRKDPSSGNEFHKEFEKGHKTLYPEIQYDGFHWGLAIDLNLCTGCNSCVIACQAENNIPVVGKSEVTKRRIMHWIKIDRYYSDDQGDPKVYFQPLACQHCDNAPCENVCPVSATNHSSEGLNQMAYNRCVGTKYCINNCPYKVRRFNWFRYTANKVFDYNAASDLGKMVLNPDVTVRERGVVEKCSFCVQRIQEKKLQAKLENRVLADNEIKTACMQSCPAGAIVFGNLNDPGSRVSSLFGEPRTYHLLEELHTLPNTAYLTKIRNDEDPEV